MNIVCDSYMFHEIYIKKDHETISSERQVNLNE